MKTTLTVSLITFCFIWMAKPVISIRPFKIYFIDWMFALGLFLIVLGGLLMYVHGHNSGKTEGMEDAIQYFRQDEYEKK